MRQALFLVVIGIVVLALSPAAVNADDEAELRLLRAQNKMLASAHESLRADVAKLKAENARLRASLATYESSLKKKNIEIVRLRKRVAEQGGQVKHLTRLCHDNRIVVPVRIGRRKALAQEWPEVSASPPETGQYRQAPPDCRVLRVIGPDAAIIERPADKSVYIHRKTLRGRPLEYRRRRIQQLLFHVKGIPEALRLIDRAPFRGILLYQGGHRYGPQIIQSFLYCGQRTRSSGRRQSRP